MKVKLLFILIFAFAGYCYAQKPKASPKEKVPTQAEMRQLMDEAQKMIHDISPGEKKIMDSLGIKMPDMKQVKKNASGVSDAQLKEAYEDEMRIVPKKDAVRIAWIQPVPLTDASVGDYLLLLHKKVIPVLKPGAKALAEEMYAELEKENTPNAVGLAADGLWMAGKQEPAIYLMGKACADNPSNTDNMYNYASMLLMNGGEHLAMPVLHYLNKKFPGNSSILNNLSQAWFGLGDMAKAGKYADSVTRMYAIHPQATMVKAAIEESKGNKDQAVALIKESMQHAPTAEKEERLRKLGYKPKVNDARLPARVKNDPFNLGGFSALPFPKSVDECIAMEPAWQNFMDRIDDKIAQLSRQYEEAGKLAFDKHQERMNIDLAMIKASQQAMSPQGVLASVPMYAIAAARHEKNVTDEWERKKAVLGEKINLFFSGEAMRLQKEYDETMNKLREEDLEQTGEGLPNKDYCPKYKTAADNYLKGWNSALEMLFKEQLAINKTYLDEVAHWKMLGQWPEQFEATKLQLKMGWLDMLKAQRPLHPQFITDYKCSPVNIHPPKGELAQFDDVACQYHSEMDLIVYNIRTDCSRMTAEFNAKYIKFKLKQDMDKESFAERFTSCTIEARGSVGEKVKVGPIEVGVKAEGGIGLEFDPNGLKDAYVIAGITAKVGPAGGGAEGRVNIISGNVSGKGKGIFSGIK